MIELDAIQEAVGIWWASQQPNETIIHAGLGVAEETGELCRAILKREHGTRGTYEQWTAEVRKEAADVFINLLDVAYREGFSLAEVLMERWPLIAQRDPDHDPITRAREGT